jgi:cysteine desulfurase
MEVYILTSQYYKITNRSSTDEIGARVAPRFGETVFALYLDYNATTPLDPRVFEAMKPWFLEEPGNAGSRTHEFGRRAKEAVERARETVAITIGAKPEEIIFTSGATESNNLAIFGLRQFAEQTGRRHIISTAIEHKAVLEPLEQLRREGFEIELAPVTSGGYVEPDEISRRLRPDTLLVSVMHANNETGVLQPVVEIGHVLVETDTYFHVDAAQTFGKEVEEVRLLECDFLSISGHKIYGPKGVGALYVRRRPGRPRALTPLLLGGGQERGMRSGTLPVPLIAGLGKAAELASGEFHVRREHEASVRVQFLAGLADAEFDINGAADIAQPHVVNIHFRGVDSQALLAAMRVELAFSTGAACSSQEQRQSHVLRAMGMDSQRIECSVRFSWGKFIPRIPTERLKSVVAELRETC